MCFILCTWIYSSEKGLMHISRLASWVQPSCLLSHSRCSSQLGVGPFQKTGSSLTCVKTLHITDFGWFSLDFSLADQCQQESVFHWLVHSQFLPTLVADNHSLLQIYVPVISQHPATTVVHRVQRCLAICPNTHTLEIARRVGLGLLFPTSVCSLL